MNRIIAITTLLCMHGLSVLNQAGNESKAKKEEKIYLPVAVFNDMNAVSNAIPALAKQVIATVPQKGISYQKQAASYYLLMGEYKRAVDAVDSVRKSEEDPTWGLYLKIYAEAKMKDKSEGEPFREYFKKEFATIYNNLSFDEKVGYAGMDSSYLNELNKAYKNSLEEFRTNKSDSISIKDAKDFSLLYRDHMLYNKIVPLIAPFTGNPAYKTSFPAIKSNTWGGVVPVQGIDEIPDPDMPYKFVMELTSFGMPKEEDSVSSKDMNLALRDVARTLNLHVAAGIPKKNIEVVLAVHGSALNAFLTNDKYKKKYGIDNPNIPLLEELQDFGVKMIMCGQAMHYQKLKREHLIPGIKVALTAQTVISSYQLKNYVFSDLSLRE